jgi:hypothetical protein
LPSSTLSEMFQTHSILQSPMKSGGRCYLPWSQSTTLWLECSKGSQFYWHHHHNQLLTIGELIIHYQGRCKGCLLYTILNRLPELSSSSDDQHEQYQCINNVV